jgi:hypothetical protein
VKSRPPLARHAGTVVALGAAMLSAPCALAGIVYDAALEGYRVTDYPAEYPCTPELLAEMDRLLGLGKVKRDSGTGVCTVECPLFIGGHDGTNTYFQVGPPECPEETLIMQGDLYVCPYYIPGESPHEQWWHAPQRVNRLTLGDEHRPEIRAALKFDGAGPEKRLRLLTGVRPDRDGETTIGHGGQFMAWNSLVTALHPSPERSLDGLTLRGDGFVFVNSTLSWVEGMMLYGASVDWRKTVRIADSTFEHGGAVVIGGKLELEGCRLRHCDTAVLDYGSLNVVMRNCTFEDNRCNWQLRFPGRTPPTLECLDCIIGPPQTANPMQRQETASTRALQEEAGTLQNPQFVSKRHLIVRVVDANGEPVPEAEITVRAEQSGAGLDEGKRYHTDATGHTAGETGPGALLLPELRQVVTGEQSPPATTQFTYTITAVAGGRTASIEGVRPDRSWGVVTVTLK